MAKNDFKEGFNKGYKSGLCDAMKINAERIIQKDILDNFDFVASELKEGDTVELFGGKIVFVMKDGRLQA